MDRKPMEEGASRVGPVVDARGVLEKYELRVGAAESLAALAGEYAFFTPALLYLHGQFRDAALVDFLYQWQVPEARFYYRRFDKPVFRGLEARSNGDRAWNHVLWAVLREHWQPLVDCLCGLTMADSGRGLVYQYGLQELAVLDPLAADKAALYRADLPQLEVGAFGINAGHFRAAFDPGPGPLLCSPRLQFHPPDEAAVVFAAAFFKGQNPILARDWFRAQQENQDHEG
jgi:hypothetical protein